MSEAPEGVKVARARAFKLHDGSGLWSVAFDDRGDRFSGDGVDLDDVVRVPEARARALVRAWNDCGARKPAPAPALRAYGPKSEVDRAVSAARGLRDTSRALLDVQRRTIRVDFDDGASLAVDIVDDLVQWRTAAGVVHTFKGRAPTTKLAWYAMIRECRRLTTST